MLPWVSHGHRGAWGEEKGILKTPRTGFTGEIEKCFAPGSYRVEVESSSGEKWEGSFIVRDLAASDELVRIPLK